MCPEESTCFRKIKKIRGSRQNEGSKDMRNALKDYVNSEMGSVGWQLKYVRSTGNED